MDDEERKKLWIAEQLAIASQVIVLPDVVEEDNGLRFLEVAIVSYSNREKVPSSSTSGNVLYYGGVDVSFPNLSQETDNMAVAVYVIMEYPSMQIVYQDEMYFNLTVPYIPSFLSFREIEPTVQLIQRQQSLFPQYTPSVILVDGNGIWHPRRAGFASAVGVRTALPTIGIGKTLYCEGGITKEMVQHAISGSIFDAVQFYSASQPSRQSKEQSLVLFDRKIVQSAIEGEANGCHGRDIHDLVDVQTLMRELSSVCIGLAIPLSAGGMECEPSILAYALVGQGGRQTKPSIGTKNPIFVSVGHVMSLREAVTISARLCVEARIPEPLRQADLRGRELLRQKQNAAIQGSGN